MKTIDAGEEIVAGPGSRGTERQTRVAASGITARPETNLPDLSAGMSRTDVEGPADTGPLTIPVTALPDAVIPSEPASAAVSEPGYLAAAGHLIATWARGRSLGPGSAYGVAAAFGLCAAAWFTAGTRTDSIRGVAALCVAYLAWLAGRGLASAPDVPRVGGRQRGAAARVSGKPRRSGPAMGARVADGVVADGVVADGSPGTVSEQARRAEAGWLAAVSWWIPECVVYACLAIGAAADGWGKTWAIAVAVICLVAVRDIMTTCFRPPAGSEPEVDRARRVLGAALRFPAGVRLVLIGLVVPVSGPRAALLTVLVCAGLAVVIGIFHGKPADASRTEAVLWLRDDGVLARQAGRIVRGNLLPLPPALLGFAAVITLAVLGMRNLSGLLVIGPALIMLLAAPGSSSDHAGRLDWMVPILLLGAQLVYIVALGAPGPVGFALCAALLLHYIDLAWSESPALPARPGQLARPGQPGQPTGVLAEHESWLGWEGRMLFVGLAAAAGLTTFAYLALTAYLGVLVGAKIVTSGLREDSGK